MSAAPNTVAAAMARIRASVEARMAEGGTPDPKRLAGYDTAALGRLLRPRLEADGRGWRAIGDEIGVTITDLSRICRGEPVSAAKAFAACDWLGLDARRFYRPAGGRARKGFTGKALKQPVRAKGGRDAR